MINTTIWLIGGTAVTTYGICLVLIVRALRARRRLEATPGPLASPIADANETCCLVPEASAFWIEVQDSRGGRAYPMPSKRLILGTHDTAGIRLNDEFVSRHHLSVRVSSHGGIHVADLDSTNGTFVNGEKAQRAEVRPGDEICIGKTKIHFIEADGRQGDNNIAVAC